MYLYPSVCLLCVHVPVSVCFVYMYPLVSFVYMYLSVCLLCVHVPVSVSALCTCICQCVCFMYLSVACKRSRWCCQKCRWQVTAKHANTLHMWLCNKWHGAWLYGVHRTCAEMAAVSCGTSHASAVSTPLWWIFQKTRYKKLVTLNVEPHASAVNLLKRAENNAI